MDTLESSSWCSVRNLAKQNAVLCLLEFLTICLHLDCEAKFQIFAHHIIALPLERVTRKLLGIPGLPQPQHIPVLFRRICALCKNCQDPLNPLCSQHPQESYPGNLWLRLILDFQVKVPVSSCINDKCIFWTRTCLVCSPGLRYHVSCSSDHLLCKTAISLSSLPAASVVATTASLICPRTPASNSVQVLQMLSKLIFQ